MKIEINAQPREIVGRRVKSVRQSGYIPAVIYGRGFEPKNVQVPLKDFQKVYAEAGESTMIYVDLNGQEYPAIIHDVALDPVSDEVIHADFYKVRLDEKIKADIPIVLIGESPAVKELGGILVKNINEVEVEGFPQDLPHQFDVDISKLEKFGDQVQMKDLSIPINIEIKANPDDIIALVQEPISEEELKAQLETPTAGVEEVEVIEKEKKEKTSEEAGADTDATAPVDTQKEKKS